MEKGFQLHFTKGGLKLQSRPQRFPKISRLDVLKAVNQSPEAIKMIKFRSSLLKTNYFKPSQKDRK